MVFVFSVFPVFDSMKNVNVTLDEETWRAARVFAAEHDTSVSALVRESLRRLKEKKSDAEADRASRVRLADLLDSAALDLGYTPWREKTYREEN